MQTSIKTIIFFAFVVATVTAAVPSYIHVCGRKSPQVEECLRESLQTLTDKLKAGIPELDIPSLDPYFKDHLDIASLPHFTAHAKDVSISGLGSYTINSLHYDTENLKTEFNVTFKDVQLNGSYSADAKLLINFQGTGKVYLETKNINTKIVAQFKTVMKDGVKYAYLESVSTKMLPVDYTVDFEMDDQNTLYDTLRQLLRENYSELMEAALPNLERALSEECVQLGNKICSQFTFDELFPDTE